MIAPNGNKSNLTPEQYKLVRTPEFKAWFGDWENSPETSSKVVDENGEPLIVYHSSNKEFNKFEKEKISENFEYSFGFHFSNDIDDSKEYGKITKSFFLKIINPFVFNVNDNTNGSVFIDNNRYHAINEIVKSRKTQKEIDGVIAYSLTNGYVTMYDTQIKLADGTNTTFDNNKVDIRYERGGLIAPNGRESNLTIEQYKLVRTPQFKAWFGDWENSPETSSKVVDENGEPLVVYHGGRSFTKFNKGEGVDKGIYFTNNKDFALFFAHQNEIISRDNNNYDYNDIPEDILETGEPFDEKYLKYAKLYTVFLSIKNPKIVQSIDAKDIPKNYELYKDGFIALSTGDFAYKGGQFIVFEPEQIKLADGTNTTFDSSNPDIRYKEGGTINKINNQEDFKKLFIDNGFSENDVYEISQTGYFKYIEFIDKGTILVYRTLQLPSKIADEFIHLKHQNIGEYWTLNKNFISAIWGEGQYEEEDTFNIVCTGHLRIKDIDWVMMRYAFNDDFHNFTDEYEIRGKNGGDAIKVVKCNYEENMSKGGRTISQTPAPKSDRLKGSKVNKEGSATSEGSSTIELSDKTIDTLKAKLEEFKKSHPSNNKITLNDLKAVYRRGSGAYSTSHRPTITGGAPNSRAAWSFARVNKFLKKASGEKVKAAYVQDDDLFKYEQGGLINKEQEGILKTDKINGRFIIEDILEKAQIKYNFNFSHIYASEYWVVDGNYYRVADHDKIKESVYQKGVNDFRNHYDFYIALKSKLDLSDKSQSEMEFKNDARFKIKQEGEYYRTPDRTLFDNIDNALDYMWRKHLYPPKEYEQGGLIAPNGKESNLTAEQYNLVRTPEFKAWFGDWEKSPETASKVVDGNGEPMVMYHGTGMDFNIFDKLENKRKGNADGFHFTNSLGLAKFYANQHKYPKIITAFLSIKNYIAAEIVMEYAYKLGIYDAQESYTIATNHFVNKGFDGIKYFENYWRDDKISDVFAAVYSNQIKLADGTNTTFDSSNPDIRYDKGGKTFNDKELLARWKKGESIGFTAIAHLKAKGLIPRADGNKKVSQKYMQDGGEIGLIAPNGKQSNLTPEEYKLVRTPEFKSWFGDWEYSPETSSKVIDENGEPLVMWHYAKRLQYELDKFYTFRVDKQLGSHFGTLQQAQNLKYIPSGESEVKKSNKELSDFRYYKVFLNIKNPIRLKDVGIFEIETLTDAIGDKNVDWRYLNDIDRKSTESFSDRAKNVAKNNGYDGAVYLNRYESDADSSYILSLDDASDKVFKDKVPSAEDSWIAFYPNQIKLADGTNTEFNSENPDIRYEDGGYLDEEAQQYVDIISMDANNPKYSKYKEILKTKFGIDYDLDYANHDENIIDNADLEDLKGINDFLNYDNYVKYAYEIFRKRGFIENQPKHIEGIVSIDLAKKIGSYLGFSVELKEYFGTGNYAEVRGDTLRMPQEVDINTFIHEIGHYFDHQYSKEYDGKAKDSTYATSIYMIRNSAEVFAENFMTYFIAPEWLLINMPMIFYELDNQIPQLYKDTINDLIKEVNNSNTSIKYADGGEIKVALFNELDYVEKHIGDAKTPSQILYLSSKLSGSGLHEDRELNHDDRIEFYEKRNELREKIETVIKKTKKGYAGYIDEEEAYHFTTTFSLIQIFEDKKIKTPSSLTTNILLGEKGTSTIKDYNGMGANATRFSDLDVVIVFDLNKLKEEAEIKLGSRKGGTYFGEYEIIVESFKKPFNYYIKRIEINPDKLDEVLNDKKYSILNYRKAGDWERVLFKDEAKRLNIPIVSRKEINVEQVLFGGKKPKYKYGGKTN